MRLTRIILTMLLVFSIPPLSGAASYSPLSVKIEPAKEVFEPPDIIEGTVIVRNESPLVLPAVFDVQLLRDQEVFQHVTTAIDRVLPGQNRYSFKTLGVPFLQAGPATAGRWQLQILQHDVPDSYTGKAGFMVTSSPASAP